MAYSVRSDVPGAELTTIGSGGLSRTVVDTNSEAELLAALVDYPDALCLGGGSNLVISDDGFDGTIIRAFSPYASGIRMDASSGVVRVEATVVWDALVAATIEAGLQGLEATSGVPGSIGGGIVQNAGAYGQEIGDVVVSVDAWDRVARKRVTLPRQECGFLYRNSRFKHDDTRQYVITSAQLQFAISDTAMPRYGDVSELLATRVGHAGPYALDAIRNTVLEVRMSKGMVIGASEPSAGSFFTNPALDAAQIKELEGRGFKLNHRSDGVTLASAAALIEAAGFSKGFAKGRAGLSEHHVLALVNLGGASTTDLLSLASDVREAVRKEFAVELSPEPVMLGFASPPLD